MNPERPPYNQPYPSAHSSYDDEIDLWQLVTTLWAGKLWIIGIAVVCGLLGLWYAKTTEEEWTAEAQVVAPDYADFQQATEYIQKLLPILDSTTFEEKTKAINFHDAEAVLKRFISLFSSVDNKREFLLEHEIFDQYKKTQGSDAESEEKVLARWASNITAAAPKTEPNNFNLSATSWTAANSQKLLADYIEFTNNQVINELQINLRSLLATRINALKSQLKTQEYDAKMNIEREINRLTHSLAVAKAAGIQTPIADPGVTRDIFEINLGQKAIQAKIDELKSVTDFAVMNVNILNTQNQLNEAEAIELSSSPVFNSYKFTQRPAEPLSRDAPKTLLIILAGIIVGGIIGVIYVLLSHAIRSRTKAV